MMILLVAAFLGYVFGFAVAGWLASAHDNAFSARLDSLERKLDFLLNHLGAARGEGPVTRATVQPQGSFDKPDRQEPTLSETEIPSGVNHGPG